MNYFWKRKQQLGNPKYNNYFMLWHRYNYALGFKWIASPNKILPSPRPKHQMRAVCQPIYHQPKFQAIAIHPHLPPPLTYFSYLSIFTCTFLCFAFSFALLFPPYQHTHKTRKSDLKIHLLHSRNLLYILLDLLHDILNEIILCTPFPILTATPRILYCWFFPTACCLLACLSTNCIPSRLLLLYLALYPKSSASTPHVQSLSINSSSPVPPNPPFASEFPSSQCLICCIPNPMHAHPWVYESSLTSVPCTDCFRFV